MMGNLMRSFSRQAAKHDATILARYLSHLSCARLLCSGLPVSFNAIHKFGISTTGRHGLADGTNTKLRSYIVRAQYSLYGENSFSSLLLSPCAEPSYLFSMRKEWRMSKFYFFTGTVLYLLRSYVEESNLCTLMCLICVLCSALRQALEPPNYIRAA